jgi:polyisoprenoid-binding protein YceI
MAALALLVLAGGCRAQRDEGPAPSPGADPRPSAVPHETAPVPSAAAHADDPSWAIDPDRTVFTIIVRRAGPLARLGHDHVITSAGESGTVRAGASPAESTFEVQLPVAQFEVDLPSARATAGAEFSAAVPEDARAGTRRNMLRPEVLDAGAFPLIKLRSGAASGGWSQPVIRVAVELRGVTCDYEIPIAVERGAQGVLARGELRLNQSDFGITPFSAAGGAIQVADTLEVRFEIAAGAP